VRHADARQQPARPRARADPCRQACRRDRPARRDAPVAPAVPRRGIRVCGDAPQLSRRPRAIPDPGTLTMTALADRTRTLAPGLAVALVVAAAATFLSEHYTAPVML